MFLMPLIFCGDQVTDIIYLIDNWDSFANEHLKNAIIAFTVINAIVCYVVSLIVMCRFRGIYEDRCKVFMMIFCCAWIPVSSLIFVLLWAKFISLVECCGCLNSFGWEQEHGGRSDDSTLQRILWFLVYIQVFVQDIPQIILQSINNTKTQQWDILQIISLVFSLISIGFMILKFMCVEGSKDESKI